MFAYLFRYRSEMPIFSFCCFCWFFLQNWSKALGIGVGDMGWVALDPGSKDWEGRSQEQSMAGPGTPGVYSVPARGACALELTMAGSAGWWRGDSSFQDVWTELSFLNIGVDELEDFSSEWVSWDAETELRVLKSKTQRVPPLDFGTSVSEPFLWHGFDFFSRCFTPFGHWLIYDKRLFLSFRGYIKGHQIRANLD